MKHIIKQHGLTLVELLVTLAISAVILSGVVTLYVNSLSQSKLTSNLTSIQESGRFALDLISRDIRMAGYTGCLAYDQLEESDNPDTTKPVGLWGLLTRGGQNFVLQAGRGIQGGEATNTAWGQTVPLVTTTTARVGTQSSTSWTWDGNVMTDNYAEAIPGSDIVRTWTTGEISADVSNYDDTTGAIVITVPAGNGFKAGDMVMYATCGNGNRIFGAICSTTNTTITLSSSCNNQMATVTSGLKKTPDASTTGVSGGEVFSYRDVTYFVGKRDNSTTTPPSLFRAVGSVSREMVEGVENLQILYGVDVNHAEGEARVAGKYVTAAQVGSRWNDVVSVKISVLMRSFEKRIAQGTSSISFNGATISMNDGYFRQVYSTTIALRNRAVGEVDGMYQ